MTNLRRTLFVSRSFLAHAAAGAAYPLRCWNWKSALLSVIIRSIALFCAVAGHGRHAGLRAAMIEACYVSVTAGIYAALQQGALRIEPRWKSNLAIVAGVPVLAQTLDYLVQHAAGTPNMRAASVGMVFWGLLSASFHLHLMRHGSMLVGEGSRSLGSDMKRMPRLVATFVAAPVIWCIRVLRPAAQTESDRELTPAA